MVGPVVTDAYKKLYKAVLAGRNKFVCRNWWLKHIEKYIIYAKLNSTLILASLKALVCIKCFSF